MPASYAIDRRLGVVVCLAWGRLTDDDLVEQTRQLAMDERFDPALRQLVDWRPIAALDVSTAGVRSAALLDPFYSHTRRAFVVATDAAYGMALMYLSVTGTSEIAARVERELMDAVLWLGINPSELAVSLRRDGSGPDLEAKPPQLDVGHGFNAS